MRISQRNLYFRKLDEQIFRLMKTKNKIVLLEFADMQTKCYVTQPQIGVPTIPLGSPGQRCIPGRQPGTQHTASGALSFPVPTRPCSPDADFHAYGGWPERSPRGSRFFPCRGDLSRPTERHLPRYVARAPGRGLRASARGIPHPDPRSGRATVCPRKIGGTPPGQHPTPPEGGRRITPFASPEAE